jgi:hypothetical protein
VAEGERRPPAAYIAKLVAPVRICEGGYLVVALDTAPGRHDVVQLKHSRAGWMRRSAGALRWGWCAVLAGLAASGQVVYAHHSIARVYDGARELTVAGVVAEFRFINPHPLLIVEVSDESGATELWQLEMDNRWELSQIGMTANTFMPGDRVIASGSLARTQDFSLYIRRLERPADGLTYEQIGNAPTLVFGGR